jgi:hypothetical protein
MDSDSHSATFSIQDEGLFHVAFLFARFKLFLCIFMV